MGEFSSYKSLIVWQKSIELVSEIYRLTANFPKTETYGLVSQMRRCSVSIPSNIAEGYRRLTSKQYRQFLQVSFASGGELETQIIIAKKIGMLEGNSFIKSEQLLDEIMRMLNSMFKKIN